MIRAGVLRDISVVNGTVSLRLLSRDLQDPSRRSAPGVLQVPLVAVTPTIVRQSQAPQTISESVCAYFPRK